MIAAARKANGFDVTRALAARDPGLRLAAYVYLYERPKTDLLPDLTDSVADLEMKPFNQYWGLQAVRRTIELPDARRLHTSIRNRLAKMEEELPPGTDRAYELRRILSLVGD
jgi:hypothetical protein